MMKGKNTCGWLVLNSTELCGRRCIGDYCKIHLALQRKGSYTKPCSVCGKCVTNKILLCMSCWYSYYTHFSMGRRNAPPFRQIHSNWYTSGIHIAAWRASIFATGQELVKQHYVERAAAALTVRITCLRSARVVRFRRPVDLAEEAYRVICNYAAPVVERSLGNDIYLWRRGLEISFC